MNLPLTPTVGTTPGEIKHPGSKICEFSPGIATGETSTESSRMQGEEGNKIWDGEGVLVLLGHPCEQIVWWHDETEELKVELRQKAVVTSPPVTGLYPQVPMSGTVEIGLRSAAFISCGKAPDPWQMAGCTQFKMTNITRTAPLCAHKCLVFKNPKEAIFGRYRSSFNFHFRSELLFLVLVCESPFCLITVANVHSVRCDQSQ